MASAKRISPYFTNQKAESAKFPAHSIFVNEFRSLGMNLALTENATSMSEREMMNLGQGAPAEMAVD